MEDPNTQRQLKYEDIGSFCKYVGNSEEVMKGLFINKKIRFTQPYALNYPLEFCPIISIPCEYGQYTTFNIDGVMMPNISLWYAMQLIEKQVNEYGVLSLTKNPVAFDMWSKYANGHKGFLIELKADFNNNKAFKSREGEIHPVRKVKYVNIFKIEIADCLEDGRVSIPKFNEQYFFTKAKRWKSEKEYRLVRPLEEIGKKPIRRKYGTYREPHKMYFGDFPLEVIQSITFGANMMKNDKEFIIRQCWGTDIQFMQCVIYRDQFDDYGLAPKVTLLPIENRKTLSTILKLRPSVSLIENDALVEKQEISLKSIKELPYYAGFEDQVRIMYMRRSRKRN